MLYHPLSVCQLPSSCPILLSSQIQVLFLPQLQGLDQTARLA
jgi:hypothetical protein